MVNTIQSRLTDPAQDSTVSRYGTLGVILACLAAMAAVLAMPGCSGGSAAHAVDTSRARDALVIALDHWKQGDTPGSLPSSSTPMTVQDFDWQGGAKLLDYQVQGEGEPRDANLSIKVKLSLDGLQGKSKKVEKTVSYLVTTSPSVTVFRDTLKR
jgi:hypothetical protein